MEHGERGRLNEMANNEKMAYLRFGGLQAEGAGLGDGSLGFLAPGFTSGSYQASAKVCGTPSPGLCNAIALHPLTWTSAPDSCPEGTDQRVWQQSRPLLPHLQVGLLAAKVEGLHPG